MAAEVAAAAAAGEVDVGGDTAVTGLRDLRGREGGGMVVGWFNIIHWSGIWVIVVVESLRLLGSSIIVTVCVVCVYCVRTVCVLESDDSPWGRCRNCCF